MLPTSQRRAGPLAAVAAILLAVAAADPGASFVSPSAQAPPPPPAVQPQFFPDDPVWMDDDRAFDASGAKPVATGDIYDFAQQTFLGPGERVDRRALNVNTLDEVPDSSWFTNRIGRHAMSREEIVRGPDRRPRPVIDGWPIVAGKSEGRQPGYRVQDPEGHLWQIEFDPPSNPEMASAVETIGTAVYHALGYNVVEVYVTDVDPERQTISPKATVRSPTTPGGRRPFTKADVADVLARAARRPDGRYRVLASRFADGSPLGSFRYDGQRPDDPNDVFPHEHRRELRGNRVFSAWLNHDDSRGLNSLDMLEKGAGGKASVRHYMFDFGSIMGSGTVFAEKPRGGHEYIVDTQGALLTALTLGLYAKPWITIRYPKVPPSVGRFEAARFRPEAWKAEYPNPAFENMRADDAFWAARLVARFTPDDLAALVAKGEYSDPAASSFVTEVLVERRRKVLATWLNAVTPLVEGSIVGGQFRASNAAIDAGVADAPRRYVARWFAWDNPAGVQRPIGAPVELAGSAPVALALPEALASPGAGEYIGITVTGDHPAHAGWAAHPVTFSFRRTTGGWEAVGISRERRQEDPR
jgi:hypothetical protein